MTHHARHIEACRSIWFAMPDAPIKINGENLARRAEVSKSAVGFYAKALANAGQVIKHEVSKRAILYSKTSVASYDGFLAAFPEPEPQSPKVADPGLCGARNGSSVASQSGAEDDEPTDQLIEATNAAILWQLGFDKEGRTWAEGKR